MYYVFFQTPVKYDCPYCGVDTTNKILMAKHLRSCHKDKLPRRKNSALNYQDFLNASISSDDDDDEDDDDSKTVHLIAFNLCEFVILKCGYILSIIFLICLFKMIF